MTFPLYLAITDSVVVVDRTKFSRTNALTAIIIAELHARVAP